MHTVCVVVGLHVTVKYINLYHWQQCKFYVPVFEEIIYDRFALFSHVTYKRRIETKERSFARGLL